MIKRLAQKLYRKYILWWSILSLDAVIDYSAEYPKLYRTAKQLLYTLQAHPEEINAINLAILGEYIRQMTKYQHQLMQGIDMVPIEYKYCP